MKTALMLAAGAAAAALAGPASAAPIDWTRAGAVAAVKTAPLWKDQPPASISGYQSPFTVVAVTRAVPYGPRRRFRHQVRAARWDMTVSMIVAPATAAVSYNFCVTALSPVKTAAPFTVFRIGGWNFGGRVGGCVNDDGQPYPQDIGDFYEWGGSVGYRG